MSSYERLSALDETFLAFETPNTYMHIALVTIFESGTICGPKGLDIAKVRRYVGSRLHLVPRYRQKVRLIPMTGDVVWVDDAHFQLEYHVRHTSLPRPGTMKQLQRRCAEILERPLDRERPLWESWFIEGLSGGRYAMLTKVHHCMVDGVAGVDILAALLGTEASRKVAAAQRWKPRSAPTDGELLRDELGRRVRKSGALLRGIGQAAAQPGELRAELPRRFGTLWNLLRAGASGPPATSFNRPIGPHRRIGWTQTPIASIKEIKKSLGGTLNDVVLTVVAGAMRRFQVHRGEATKDPLRVVVPVSVRGRGDQGGNRVSAWMVDLPTPEAMPLGRYNAIAKTTRSLKDDDQAWGAQMLTEAAELTTGNILNLGARLINQSHLYNSIVTNVPGPRESLFLLDSKMVEAYPHVPLFADQGLGIALFSYGDTLFWGIAADWDLVPDVEILCGFVEESFSELRVAAKKGRLKAPQSRRKPARKSVAKGSIPNAPLRRTG